jgi:hypothetical protein
MLSTVEKTVPVVPNSQEVEDTDTPLIGTITKFYGRYGDSMEMYAPAAAVAEYLNGHAGWFTRCAEPMKVHPLGENGYALTIGRFGAFGYEVEPKIGLELLPPDDVDYHAALQLKEDFAETIITKVEWELDLTVCLHFPRFIQRLPKSLIQSTGDRLLNQIVRQVSRRLTRKVQEDFHNTFGVSQ